MISSIVNYHGTLYKLIKGSLWSCNSATLERNCGRFSTRDRSSCKYLVNVLICSKRIIPNENDFIFSGLFFAWVQSSSSQSSRLFSEAFESWSIFCDWFNHPNHIHFFLLWNVFLLKLTLIFLQIKFANSNSNLPLKWNWICVQFQILCVRPIPL